MCGYDYHNFVDSLGSGIGQGRITDNLATFVKDVDGAFTISDEKSIVMLYELLDSEGLYLGASSALNVVAAIELAEKLGKGELAYFKSSVLFLNKAFRLQGCNCSL